MHDVPNTNAILDDHNSRSSIYEKTTPDERRKYDRAIVNRDPPTYRGVFEKFRLAEKGISFTAFYNYARRIRTAAQSYNLAELVTPSQADLNQTLPRLLADRLIDTLLYQEDATPVQIHRLTLSYASAISTAIKAHKACDVFPRRPVAAGAPAGRTPDSEPPPQGGAEWPSNTIASPPMQVVCASAVQNPVYLASPVPSSSPIPNSAPSHLCSSASSAEKNSEDLIPLATMRRNLPNPALERARLDPLALSNPNPVNRAEDPPWRINPVPSSVGAIDESPDSHGRGELPKLPLIKQDFPDPDPQREALRLRVRAAYGLKERPRVNNWIDPALIAEYDLSPNAPDYQLSEDQLRRRDLRRALIDYGLLKQDAPAPDSS